MNRGAVLGAAFFALLSTLAYGADLRDATNTLVHVPDRPTRIVTLAPSVAELASELLGMDLQRIVGVSEYTNYPPALEKTESVGSYQRFNIEKVVALKPDLVLATEDGNPKDQVLHLRELGICVFVLDTGSFSKIETAMEQTGQILGEEKEGLGLVSAFKARLETIRARAQARTSSPKRVMIQLGSDPLIVAGGGSFLNDELDAVGARNIYADLKQRYPHPSVEDATERNPDVILVMAFGSDLKPFQKMAAEWPHAKNVQVVYAETLLRPSMRLLEGLGVLEKALYGRP